MTDRKESALLGSSRLRRRISILVGASGTFASEYPRRNWICQSMLAMRSLMMFIARRGTGFSAKRRRFAGVPLGSNAFGGRTGPMIDGNGTVLRDAPSTLAAAKATPSRTAETTLLFAARWLQIRWRFVFQLTDLRLSCLFVNRCIPNLIRSGPEDSLAVSIQAKECHSERRPPGRLE